MAAQIVFDDGGGPVVGSLISPATDVDVAVTASNFDDTGVLGHKWEFLDTPILSSNLRPIPADTFLSTVVFTPDVIGHSVLLKLTTYTDVARTIIDGTDQKVMGLRYPPPFDWLIPAAGETIEVDMLRGWAEEVNRQLRESHQFIVDVETTADFQMWVRDSDGDDADDGLTQATALKTLTALPGKIPHNVRHDVVVHTGVHLGSGYVPPVMSHELTDGGRVAIVGDGAGTGDGHIELEASTAAAGTDLKGVVKTAGGLVVDANYGDTIIINPGPSEQKRTIIENTATKWLVGRDFDPAPVETTPYRIVQNTVHIDCDAADVHFAGNSSAVGFSGAIPGTAGYVLAQVRLKRTAGFGIGLRMNGSNVFCYGVELDGGTGDIAPVVENGTWFFGYDSPSLHEANIPLELGLVTGDNKQWAGWGMGQVGGGSFGAGAANSGTWAGIAALEYLSASLLGQGTLLGGRLLNTGSANVLVANNGGQLFIGGLNTTTILEAATGTPVQSKRANSLIQLAIAELRGSGDLVNANSGGHVNDFGVGFVTGTSTAGKAYQARRGGNVDFVFGAPALDGTPSSTAYSVGDAAVDNKPGSFFGAAGDFLAKGDGSEIRRGA